VYVSLPSVKIICIVNPSPIVASERSGRSRAAVTAVEESVKVMERFLRPLTLNLGNARMRRRRMRSRGRSREKASFTTRDSNTAQQNTWCGGGRWNTLKLESGRGQEWEEKESKGGGGGEPSGTCACAHLFPSQWIDVDVDNVY